MWGNYYIDKNTIKYMGLIQVPIGPELVISLLVMAIPIICLYYLFKYFMGKNS